MAYHADTSVYLVRVCGFPRRLHTTIYEARGLSTWTNRGPALSASRSLDGFALLRLVNASGTQCGAYMASPPLVQLLDQPIVCYSGNGFNRATRDKSRSAAGVIVLPHNPPRPYVAAFSTDTRQR